MIKRYRDLPSRRMVPPPSPILSAKKKKKKKKKKKQRGKVIRSRTRMLPPGTLKIFEDSPETKVPEFQIYEDSPLPRPPVSPISSGQRPLPDQSAFVDRPLPDASAFTPSPRPSISPLSSPRRADDRADEDLFTTPPGSPRPTARRLEF